MNPITPTCSNPFPPAILIVLATLTPPPACGAAAPHAEWRQYAVPEEVGWSSEKLESVRQRAEEMSSAAVLVVSRGRVVAAWGEIDRRFPCHSVRKSLLSALYGIYAHEGKIDLKKTLADIGFEDKPPPQGHPARPQRGPSRGGDIRRNMGRPIQLEIFLFEEQLFAQPTGAAEMQLLAESPTTYFSITGDTLLEFVQGGDGAITHLNISRTGRQVRLNRIK